MNLYDVERCVGRIIFDEFVPTPFVFIDRKVLERNIAEMAELTKINGVGLRPHTKTHKISAIARMQLQAGAIGLTVAKLGEALAFLEAGILSSYMIAQPFFGLEKTKQLLRMAEANEILACVDDAELAEAMGKVADQFGKAISIVLIVDTGYKRLGVDWLSAPNLVQQISNLKGIRFRGIRSHDGRTYNFKTLEERQCIAREESEKMSETADQIRRLGIQCELVSIGSTPGAHPILKNHWTNGITEIRPGNYVFYDRMQISLGVAEPKDCALHVVASIVSAPEKGRAFIDAGLKTLTGTKNQFAEGFGLILNRPDANLEKLWEECGLVSYVGKPFRIGERLVIVPNHSCEITNLAEVVFYGINDKIEGFWTPEAKTRVW